MRGVSVPRRSAVAFLARGLLPLSIVIFQMKKLVTPSVVVGLFFLMLAQLLFLPLQGSSPPLPSEDRGQSPLPATPLMILAGRCTWRADAILTN